MIALDYLDVELSELDPAFAAIVRAIVEPTRDPDHPQHVHKCASLYSDEECPDSPCVCACGAVQHFQHQPLGELATITEYTVDTSPIVWMLSDGRRVLYPDPREREDVEC